MTTLQKNIAKKFASNYNLKILFFFDADFSQSDELTPWELDGIEYLRCDKQYFQLKHELYYTLSEKKIFLHLPFAKPNSNSEEWLDFPLLSHYYANDELRIDEEAEFMQKYKLGKPHLQLVRKYKDALQTKKLQQVLANFLHDQDFTESKIRHGLICTTLDITHFAERTQIWMHLFCADNEKQQTFLNRIEKQGLGKDLSEWSDQLFGERPSEWNTDVLDDLLCRLKYNLLCENIETVAKEDTYQRLKIKDYSLRQKLKSFWTEWIQHSNYGKNAVFSLQNQAKSISEKLILKWYGIEQNYALLLPTMQQEVLLQLFEAATNSNQQNLLLQWRDELSAHHAYQYIYHVSSLSEVLRPYTNFDFSTLDEYITTYQNDLWRVDFHYRKAVFFYKSIQEDELYDAAKRLDVQLQQQYENYLKRLNVSWMQLLAQSPTAFHTTSVAKQYDFFKDNVLGKDTKIAVIISDALRYEVAQELCEALLKEDVRLQADLQPMLASIPSYTKLGMAQLLPHQTISVDTKTGISFKIDGISTEGLDNRSKILKQYGTDNDTISCQKVINFDRDQGREFFKGNNKVVYIYHNKIDAAGDSQKTFENVFEETEKTIEEIKKLFGKFKGWNIEHAFVVADHGFIFNNRPLDNATLNKAPEGALLEQHTRFCYSEKGKNHNDTYTFDFAQTTKIESDVSIVLPKAINRFGKQGSTTQYVHGGGSLQELIVPLLRYSRKREDIASVVAVRLITPISQLKLSSGTLKLSFIQEEAISSNKKENNWIVGLYTLENELCSNEENLVFNSTSSNPTERLFNILLHLNSDGSRQTHCYLRAYEATDKQRLNPKIDQRLDNQTLMEIDEF